MSERELPEVTLKLADVLALFDAAIEREDLEAAHQWAGLALQKNDRPEEARP